MIIKKNIKLAISLALLIPPVFYAQAEENIEYSPYAKRHYPTEVYFGDTHHHTANSGDAFMNGDRLSPEDAYRFARGDEIVSSTGIPAKLSRPLDFLVISDHAEGPVSYTHLTLPTNA